MAFAKGQSGNPGGRPKSHGDIRELARKHDKSAIEALVQIATNGQSEAARVSAAVALLDRAYGKPAQAVEVSGKDGGPVQTFGIGVVTTDPVEAARIYRQLMDGDAG